MKSENTPLGAFSVVRNADFCPLGQPSVKTNYHTPTQPANPARPAQPARPAAGRLGDRPGSREGGGGRRAATLPDEGGGRAGRNCVMASDCPASTPLSVKMNI